MSAAHESTGGGPRISIVDDDPSVVRALMRFCRAAGYSVLSFGSAEDFLAADGSMGADCLILDVQLPGLSGLELQKRLSEGERRVPIIFITAYQSEQARKQALDYGARAFFFKPLNSDRLLEAIQDVLAGS